MPCELLAMVMAGGMGERLRPLTDVRAKPAVPFGGIYRIIDFTLSNCINSGIRHIFILTQYKSHSLSNHLKTGWGFIPRRLGQFLEEIPAQMQMGSQWYKGTADAIRQNMSLVDDHMPEAVLILSGDHVYKMNYHTLWNFHRQHKAGLTVAVVRVEADEARNNYGVLEVDEQDRIVGFQEKPAEPRTIPGTTQCLASMGVYIFEREALRNNLGNDLDDFGKHIIPSMIASHQPVYAFDFTTLNKIREYEYHTRDGQRVKELVERGSDSDYWRDVGTLDSYWLANLDLVSTSPKFNLYGQRWPLFSCPQHFPPAKFVHDSPGRIGQALNSLVADGVIISGATVKNSILSPGVYIHSYSYLENCVLMGGSLEGGEISETAIGRHCRIRNAIIDKNATISGGTVLGYDRADDERRGLKTQSIGNTDAYVVVVPKDFNF